VTGAEEKNKNQLVVEGPDDLHCVIHLIRAHIGWPETDVPVHIKDAKGRENILKREFLNTMLSAPYTRTLGVMQSKERPLPCHWNSPPMNRAS
jgi:hypothetical protein